ncbi:MAG: hypothetical protein BZ136_08975 [Methanosphaera sp. rholeuAM74]|nr:MAG: hypothetical protein BZ136_08975 [Methanosphaera sp. rholeuAM74]
MKFRVAIDNIHGSSADSALLKEVCSLIQQAGHEVHNHGVGPNKIQRTMLSSSNQCDVMIQIAGGMCIGTLADFMNGIKRGFYHAKKGAIIYYTKGWTKYDVRTWKATRAHDDNFSPQSSIAPYLGKTLPEIYSANQDILMPLAYGTTAQELVNMLLNGASGSGSTVEIVEGFVESGRGGAENSSPQFWNNANYEPYTEIAFIDFEVTEAFPRSQTMEFETTENIDLTCGRVAVLLKGDCNTFGGIILKKDFDSKNRTYKYQCQGFMERIMANGIYAVYNGSKTVYEIITEVLADIGLPSVGLRKLEDYNTAITKENQELLEKDKDLVESSDMFEAEKQTSNWSSTIKDDTLNPFKRKPKGIYDCDTIYEFFCTLLYDYGVNIDFYGDPNGIPIFEICDLETWKQDVYIFSPKRGFENDYDYGYDITNSVSQVVVRSISATSGTGEIYTAEELLGVPIQDYEGRMGVVIANPANTSGTQNTVSEYQDSEGNKYNSSQVLTTNGQPSCKHCLKGKPSIQSYTKYWFNECPICDEEGTLESDSSGDGTTKCKECETEFCQYCGYDRKGQKQHLTELFTANNTSNITTTSSDST